MTIYADRPAADWIVEQVLADFGLSDIYDVRDLRTIRHAMDIGRMAAAPTVPALIWALADARDRAILLDAPIEMILHCPICHMQHIDEVDEQRNPGWQNPPHISHKCLGCGCVWTPCDRLTEGVAILTEHGRSDTWPAIGRIVPPEPLPPPAPAKPPRAAPNPPANCRDRMRAEGKAYDRAGCAGCNPKNKHKFTCPYGADN